MFFRQRVNDDASLSYFFGCPELAAILAANLGHLRVA